MNTEDMISRYNESGADGFSDEETKALISSLIAERAERRPILHVNEGRLYGLFRQHMAEMGVNRATIESMVSKAVGSTATKLFDVERLDKMMMNHFEETMRMRVIRRADELIDKLLREVAKELMREKMSNIRIEVVNQ
jgi:hypothetical protein